jgi:hypothetical protein
VTVTSTEVVVTQAAVPGVPAHHRRVCTLAQLNDDSSSSSSSSSGGLHAVRHCTVLASTVLLHTAAGAVVAVDLATGQCTGRSAARLLEEPTTAVTSANGCKHSSRTGSSAVNSCSSSDSSVQSVVCTACKADSSSSSNASLGFTVYPANNSETDSAETVVLVTCQHLHAVHDVQQRSSRQQPQYLSLLQLPAPLRAVVLGSGRMTGGSSDSSSDAQSSVSLQVSAAVSVIALHACSLCSALQLGVSKGHSIKHHSNAASSSSNRSSCNSNSTTSSYEYCVICICAKLMR